jgi:hypothetical protein
MYQQLKLHFLQRKPQQDATVYQFFIILYFKLSLSCFGRHTAHHQEPKLHKKLLVLHTWKAVGRAAVGRCQVAYERVQCSALLLMQNQSLLEQF